MQSKPTLNFKSNIKASKISFGQQSSGVLHVLEDDIYKGLLFEEDIIDHADDLMLEDIPSVLKPVFLTEGFSIFDWFKISSLYHIDSIPLIDSSNFLYLDSIGIYDVINKFRGTGLSVDLSSIIVLKKSSETFKYSEVFQIIEAHDAKIYGSYINNSDEDDTEIVLNIYHFGLNELLQSFRRYGYDVVSYHDEDQHRETLEENSKYLSKYLTV